MTATTYGRHRSPGATRADRVAVMLMLPLTAGALWLGSYAGKGDVAPPPDTITTEAYGDERWQDPTGLPYCMAPDDGMRPCITAQGRYVLGEDFRPLTAEEIDVLTEGDDTPPELAATRVWEDCFTNTGAIVCLDGYATEWLASE